jgi:hypothetical protein
MDHHQVLHYILYRPHSLLSSRLYSMCSVRAGVCVIIESSSNGTATSIAVSATMTIDALANTTDLAV